MRNFHNEQASFERLHQCTQQVVKPCSEVVMHHTCGFYLIKMKMGQQNFPKFFVFFFFSSTMSLERKLRQNLLPICFNSLENKISSVSVFCCYLVAKLCPTFCDPLEHSLSVLQYLLEFAQTRVHWVCEDVQPSHPLSPLLLLPSISPKCVLVLQYFGVLTECRLLSGCV